MLLQGLGLRCRLRACLLGRAGVWGGQSVVGREVRRAARAPSTGELRNRLKEVPSLAQGHQLEAACGRPGWLGLAILPPAARRPVA